MRAFSRRRAPEEIILGRKKLESPFSLLLVFPNRYPVGMNNLGYLAVLRLVDRRRNWHSERAFWGDTRSREKNRTFSEFDLIAFSVSYEPDFLNIPDILRRAGLPEKAAARRRGPLVIAGGAAVGLNPEPLAPYVDAMVLGEGEGILGEFLDRIEGAAGENRSVLLEEVSRLRGVYVPSLMETPPPFPRPLRVPWEFPEGSRYLPREGVFAGRALIEVPGLPFLRRRVYLSPSPLSPGAKHNRGSASLPRNHGSSRSGFPGGFRPPSARGDRRVPAARRLSFRRLLSAGRDRLHFLA